MDGGLPVLGVTMHTGIAMQDNGEISREADGASFAVSPCLTGDRAEASPEADIPFLPGVRFRPTDGIGANIFVEFLELSNLACVGGSWIGPPVLLRNGDWERIR